MRSIVIRYGLIAGLLVTTWLIGSIAVCYSQENFEGNMLLGYAAMIVAFSFIFVGVKQYRDQENNGFISFGKAFKIGFLISLVASTLYVVGWLVDYYLFVPDFMEKFTAYTLKQSHADGSTPQEIATKTKELASYQEMYKNPLLVVLLTYAEVLPIGILISLLSALLLKRKEIVPLPLV